MLVLPAEADSTLFRVCLYYGLLVLVLELAVPRLLHRRVRLVLPRVALRAPATPLTAREFQRRRHALQQQLMALQNAMATPRRSPQKEERPASAVSSAKSKRPPVRTPSPPPLPPRSPSPPASSEKAMASRSSFSSTQKRKNVASSARIEPTDEGDSVAQHPLQELDERQHALPSQDPREELQSNPSGTLQSVNVNPVPMARDDQDDIMPEKKHREPQQPRQEQWRVEESPATLRRRLLAIPSRHSTENLSRPARIAAFTAGGDASSQLEALISTRRRQAGSSVHSHVLPLSRVSAAPSTLAPTAVGGTRRQWTLSQSSVAPPQSPLWTRKEPEEKKTEEDRHPAPRTSTFSEFCASFAVGGAAAAEAAVAKATTSKSTDTGAALEAVVAAEAATGADTRAIEADATEASAGAHVGDTAMQSHPTAKRDHFRAFGSRIEAEQPPEKTPRIARKILFSVEVDELGSTPAKEEAPAPRSHGKRKLHQAFATTEEGDEEDDEWRKSLAFQPRQHQLR